MFIGSVQHIVQGPEDAILLQSCSDRDIKDNYAELEAFVLYPKMLRDHVVSWITLGQGLLGIFLNHWTIPWLLHHSINIQQVISSFPIKLKFWAWRDSTSGQVLAFHSVNLVRFLVLHMVPWYILEEFPEYRTRSSPENLVVVPSHQQ